MLNFYGNEEQFLFVPESEKELMEPMTEEQKKKYNPFSILHVQMDPEMVSLYRSITSQSIVQEQDTPTGKGKEGKTITTRNKIDFAKVRDSNLKIAKSIVKKATNFKIHATGVEFPLVKDGKVTEKWCIDTDVLNAMLERLPSDLLDELITQARDVSTLTPYEKKKLSILAFFFNWKSDKPERLKEFACHEKIDGCEGTGRACFLTSKKQIVNVPLCLIDKSLGDTYRSSPYKEMELTEQEVFEYLEQAEGMLGLDPSQRPPALLLAWDFNVCPQSLNTFAMTELLNLQGQCEKYHVSPFAGVWMKNPNRIIEAFQAIEEGSSLCFRYNLAETKHKGSGEAKRTIPIGPGKGISKMIGLSEINIVVNVIPKQTGTILKNVFGNQQQAASTFLGIPSTKRGLNPAQAKAFEQLKYRTEDFNKYFNSVKIAYAEEIALVKRENQLRKQNIALLQRQVNSAIVGMKGVGASFAGLGINSPALTAYMRNMALQRASFESKQQRGQNVAGYAPLFAGYGKDVESLKQFTQAQRLANIESRRTSIEINKQSRDILGLSSGVQNYSNAWQRFRSVGAWRIISSIRNSLLLVAFASAFLVSQISKAISAAREFEKAFVGLNTIATHTGNSMVEARQAAASLASDGLMSVQEAAAALKNLLATGFSLPEAITLMKGFKDSAAFARQGALGYGESIVGATEGLKNANSILIDNAGLTKNLSVILKELGLSTEDFAHISEDAAVRTKILGGLMKELALFSGDAKRLLNTYEGSVARVRAEYLKTAVTIGNVLKPEMRRLNEQWVDMLQFIKKGFSEEESGGFKKVLVVFRTLNDIIFGLIKSISTLISLFEKIPVIGGSGSTTDMGIFGVMALMGKKMFYDPAIEGRNKALGMNKFLAEINNRKVGGDEILKSGKIIPYTNETLLIARNKDLKNLTKTIEDYKKSVSGGELRAFNKVLDQTGLSAQATTVRLTGMARAQQIVNNVSFAGRNIISGLSLTIRSLWEALWPILVLYGIYQVTVGQFLRSRQKEIDLQQKHTEQMEKDKQAMLEGIQTQELKITKDIEDLKVINSINDTYEERVKLYKELLELEARKKAFEIGSGAGFTPNKPGLFNGASIGGLLGFRDERTSKTSFEITKDGIMRGGEKYANIDEHGIKTTIVAIELEIQRLQKITSKGIFGVDYTTSRQDITDLEKFKETLESMDNVFLNLGKDAEISYNSIIEFVDTIKKLPEYLKEQEKLRGESFSIPLKGIEKEFQQIDSLYNSFFKDKEDEIARMEAESLKGPSPYSPEMVAGMKEQLALKRKYLGDLAKENVISKQNLDFADKLKKLNQELDLVNVGEAGQAIASFKTELIELVGVEHLPEFMDKIDELVDTFTKLTEAKANFQGMKEHNSLIEDLYGMSGRGVFRQYIEDVKTGMDVTLAAGNALLKLRKQLREDEKSMAGMDEMNPRGTSHPFSLLAGRGRAQQKYNEIRESMLQNKRARQKIEGNIGIFGEDDRSAIRVKMLADLQDEFGKLGISADETKRIIEAFDKQLENDVGYQAFKAAVEQVVSSLNNLGEPLTDLWNTLPKQVREAQNQITNDLRQGTISYAEYQQSMVNIDHQAYLERMRIYTQFADQFIIQTAKMIAIEYQRFYVKKLIAGATLGSVLLPILGLGAVIAGLGLASGVLAGNNPGGNFGGSSGASSGSAANRRATAGTQAPIQNLTIIPSLTITAGQNVFIGSGSVQEFSDIWGDNTIEIVKDAVETGEISFAGRK